jgi:hypothetical protein
MGSQLTPRIEGGTEKADILLYCGQLIEKLDRVKPKGKVSFERWELGTN